MKVLVTGGAGFIGSHVAEYYARRGDEVVVLDNLSRARLLRLTPKASRFNWEFLSQFKNVQLVEGDVRTFAQVEPLCRKADVIVHAAGQTAVTTSVTDPDPDFSANVLGAFNVLEAVRRSGSRKTIVYTSTNKVYGDRVNACEIVEESARYRFGAGFESGVREDFGVDLCKHTPYGCSKLAADLYMQDWALLYGHKVGVFRMSCIYGTRQFGCEDQGWVAWFAIAALHNQPITIYGDGKQVRDVLWVDDLVDAFDRFVRSDLPSGVFNTGGGPTCTLSLRELLVLLEDRLGRKIPVAHDDWRPSDQKVYISDISRLRQALGWTPKVAPQEGVERLSEWTRNCGVWLR
jgi:CDP-paratose 2-epimerase